MSQTGTTTPTRRDHGDLTFTSAETRTWNDGPVATEWWAERDGTTVAYMKTLTYPDEKYCSARLVLCDIEVRDGHRKQGLARAIIEHAQTTTGLILHTSGGYTPLGAEAFLGRIPLKPGYDEGVKYKDMTFVQDWDNKRGPS